MLTKPVELRTWYQVNEIFTSVQGEGVLTGRLATFIRLQGCTVGCSWCDSGPLADAIKDRTNGETHNTWGKGGRRMTVHEILAQVPTQHVIITGGEPTLWNLDGLIEELRRCGAILIQMETSGQNAMKGYWAVDWITWSPKQMLKWDAPYDIKFGCKEVKWVIEPALTFEHIYQTWKWMVGERGIDNVPEFVLMPEGCPPSVDNVQLAIKYLESAASIDGQAAQHWRFGDRLQYRLGVR